MITRGSCTPRWSSNNSLAVFSSKTGGVDARGFTRSREGTVVTARYIDANPVAAGIVAHPIDHRWARAYHYSRPSGPRWLSREAVESAARRERSSSDARESPRVPDRVDSMTS